MAKPKITSTGDKDHHFLKVLVYGPAGTGKTRLCATVENGIIISAEGGLLSLRDYDLPVIEVSTLADVQNAFDYLANNEEGKAYKWICIDSLSEIGEVVLAQEKQAAGDQRKAYGEMADRMTALVRAFHKLPRNIYMSCKVEPLEDNGAVKWGPSMPGKKLGPNLAYFFDAVFAMRVKQTDEGITRALQTTTDGQWTAKDRSGALATFEEPDLEKILNKIVPPTK